MIFSYVETIENLPYYAEHIRFIQFGGSFILLTSLSIYIIHHRFLKVKHFFKNFLIFYNDDITADFLSYFEGDSLISFYTDKVAHCIYYDKSSFHFLFLLISFLCIHYSTLKPVRQLKFFTIWELIICVILRDFVLDKSMAHVL